MRFPKMVLDWAIAFYRNYRQLGGLPHSIQAIVFGHTAIL